MAVRRFIASGFMGIACQMAGFLVLPAHAADKAFGEYLAGECVTCHLPSGRQVGGIPAIAGMPEISFMALMESYARRERDNQVMQAVAGKFNSDELAALAAYFASLKPE
jgi:cytochrome c553